MTQDELEGRILIVDDSPELLKFLAEVIQPKGATVLIAMTGENALEVVNEIDMGAAIYSSAVVSNGVLYVGTMSHLYAVQGQ